MLQNNSICLRKVEPTDLSLFYLWENDSDSWRGSAIHNPLSQKDLRDYIESSTGDIYKDGQLRLVATTTDDLTVGCIDLYDYDPHERRCAVGLYIDKSYRGNGYALQMLSLIEEYVFQFLHLRMVYAEVAKSNRSSVRLFEKSKLSFVAQLPSWLADGDDVLVYQLLSECNKV